VKSQNIQKARSHIVFLLGLVVGSILIYFLNQLDMETKGYTKRAEMVITAPTIEVDPQPLTKEEMEWARTAWRYFKYNYQESTGLVNSTNNYPSTTLWDTGNYLYALIAAHRLGIVDKSTFEYRIEKLLGTLERLTLYDGKLPNKVYNTIDLNMTNYNNEVALEGIGWSAIDIGRILSPLFYLKKHYGHYGKRIHFIISKWDFSYLEKDGMLQGCGIKDDEEFCVQEGRLGYEQYSANVFTLFAVGMHTSMKYTNYLGFKTIYEIDVPYDIRDKDNFGASNYVLMEPYILDGIEFGWDYHSKEFSYRLYKVQEERYKRTGVLTALTEDHIDRKPYFLYNNVFVNKEEWSAIAETGEKWNDLKTLSTKAVFGLHVLYNTPYTQKLIERVKSLQTTRGWYSGLYEKNWTINKSITCNTNAVILESLLYKTEGILLKTSHKETL
jgi:hypothetical protein